MVKLIPESKNHWFHGKILKILWIKVTLPETNSSHLKIGHPNRKVVFQPSIFRGKLAVSFREGRMSYPSTSTKELFKVMGSVGGWPMFFPFSIPVHENQQKSLSWGRLEKPSPSNHNWYFLVNFVTTSITWNWHHKKLTTNHSYYRIIILSNNLYWQSNSNGCLDNQLQPALITPANPIISNLIFQSQQ